jgi:hypothetical protein
MTKSFVLLKIKHFMVYCSLYDSHLLISCRAPTCRRRAAVRHTAPRASHLTPRELRLLMGGKCDDATCPRPPGGNDRTGGRSRGREVPPGERVGNLGQHPPYGKRWLSPDCRTERNTLRDWSRKGFRSRRKPGRRRLRKGRRV